MVNQLDAIWDASSWPERYIHSSSDVNNILAGRPVSKQGKHWTRTEVRRFVAWVKQHADIGRSRRILYRGTQSPTPAPTLPTSVTFLSTTTDQNIAREFMGRNGFLHVLHLDAGCQTFDMRQHYGANPVSREREVLVLPQHVFEFKNRDVQGRLHWSVRPPFKTGNIT